MTSGTNWVDESMFTGEPVSVEKSAGAAVTGGTVNGTGAPVFRATHVGGDTVISQIIRMVEQVQGAHPPIQGLVNRITLYSVPVVMAVAALTVLVWLVFGPVPVVTHALVAGVDRAALLAAVAGAEGQSEHPIARAIVAIAKGLFLLDPVQFDAMPGLGLHVRFGARGIQFTALICPTESLDAPLTTPIKPLESRRGNTRFVQSMLCLSWISSQSFSASIVLPA